MGVEGPRHGQGLTNSVIAVTEQLLLAVALARAPQGVGPRGRGGTGRSGVSLGLQGEDSVTWHTGA